MSAEFDAVSGKRARSWPAMLIVPAIAFLLGLAAMGWILASSERAAQWLGIARPAPVQPLPRPIRTVAIPSVLPGVVPLVVDPEVGRRLSLLEQRIGEIDSQAREAVGNADRAEGLLVAFAARRALDRGVSLGYIEGLLRQRFGDSQRQAVATIITASRQPVTLEELREELGVVGPELTGGGPDQNWWTAFRGELDGLVTVRRGGTPSTLPAERLRRATDRLEAGQVDVALAEVLRMPGREYGGDWVMAARRYVAARRALDRIETAALLDPRNPPRAPALPAAPAA